MKKYFSLAAIALSVLCSCNKEEIATEDKPHSDLIRITTGIDIGLSTKSAITDGVFPTSRDMIVSAFHIGPEPLHRDGVQALVRCVDGRQELAAFRDTGFPGILARRCNGL